VLAASACRTTITEVYQSGNVTPTADGWGCESTGQSSKYVKAIHTTADGAISVTATGFNDTNIDDKVVTLVPQTSAGAAMTIASNASSAVFKWVCGGTGTTIAPKFLPGSCRG
jgi:type IV pilus assembly protein PilA